MGSEGRWNSMYGCQTDVLNLEPQPLDVLLPTLWAQALCNGVGVGLRVWGQGLCLLELLRGRHEALEPSRGRLCPSPWQFVGRASWQREDCAASHFLRFLPFA